MTCYDVTALHRERLLYSQSGGILEDGQDACMQLVLPSMLGHTQLPQHVTSIGDTKGAHLQLQDTEGVCTRQLAH